MSSLADRLAARFANVLRGRDALHGYQNTLVNFAKAEPYSAAWVDTGLGKTGAYLTVCNDLLVENLEERILIIAPVRVAAQTWPNEIGEWEHTAWLPYTVLRAEDDEPEVVEAYQTAYREARDWAYTPAEAQKVAGKAKTARKEALRLSRARDGRSIHLINREALTWLIDLYSEWIPVKRNGKIKKKRKIVGWPYRTVIIDEASGFKDHATARFKALVAVRAQGFIDRLYELTATPAGEGYMGLFPQMFLMDLGKRLGRNITAYREEFFDHDKYKKTYKLKKGADEEITDRISDICLVMKSKDYLDREDPLFLPRRLRMSPAETKMYRELEREFILTLPDGEEIEAETAAALSSKLLQLASGAIYNKAKETRFVHDHKIEDLKQLQEEIDTPILVSYWYKSSLARLKKAFPEAHVMDAAGKIFDGRNSPWCQGKIKMLLIHPASAGHGLNGQYGPGHDLYMFDLCWSWELFYQLYTRLHRQGQKLRCRIHLPQMIGTKDELVAARLNQKESAQEALFAWVRARWAAMKRKKARA